MLVSGFTIVRNVKRYHYPVLESIRSILPVCDEFVVNVGDSDDGTLELIRSLNDPKIRIIETRWNMDQGKTVLSQQTNAALAACQGEWAFYLQSDEVIHESDLPRLRQLMKQCSSDDTVDAMRFKWMHFYGSYHRYRVDYGWFQKQDRIVRNNGQVESFGDAYAFQRKDGAPLRSRNTGCLLYHYGWVHSEEVMAQRRINAEQIGFAELREDERDRKFSYGNLNRFPPYFASHPRVMKALVEGHELSQQDWAEIDRRYWWHPLKWLKVRYKTGKRVRERIV